MKKILEVLQYGEHDIRFNTDLDVSKNPEILSEIMFDTAICMVTKLWGGNEQSVLAAIRVLSIADLGVSVNRKQMIKELDLHSKELADFLVKCKEQAIDSGITIKEFAPGIVKPSSNKS